MMKTIRVSLSWVACALPLVLGACSDSSPNGGLDSDSWRPDAVPVSDLPLSPDRPLLPDLTAPDAAVADTAVPTADGSKPLSRGLQWVRNNPIFVSGLTVSVGPPQASAVNEYFNSFNANAVHLWADGLPTEMNAWLAAKPGARWLAWVDNSGKANGQVIGGYPAGKAGRIGYQVGDEPADMAALQAMEVGVKAVRQADPDALIFLNFNTDATTQMLNYYGQMDCDVISYDQYSRSKSSYELRERIRAAGLKLGIPYWRYIKSYLSDSGDGITESDMRWDAFSGLVYGFTGHTWFVYQIKNPPHLPLPALFATPNSFTAAKTGLYQVAAQINTELKNLGRCITQLTSTDVRYIPALISVQPPLTKNWAPGAGGDPFITSIAAGPGMLLLDISVGFFTDDANERYVIVQNPRHDHGDWPIDNNNAGTIRITFDFSKAAPGLDSTKLLTLNKLSGKQEPLPLTSLGGGKAQVDVTLAAGDPLLFKYATGVPFVMGP